MQCHSWLYFRPTEVAMIPIRKNHAGTVLAIALALTGLAAH